MRRSQACSPAGLIGQNSFSRDGQCLRQRFEEPRVLLLSADGDAEVVGQAVGGERTDDDAAGLEGEEDGARVLDVEHEEVRDARSIIKAEFLQTSGDLFQPAALMARVRSR